MENNNHVPKHQPDTVSPKSSLIKASHHLKMAFLPIFGATYFGRSPWARRDVRHNAGDLRIQVIAEFLHDLWANHKGKEPSKGDLRENETRYGSNCFVYGRYMDLVTMITMLLGL